MNHLKTISRIFNLLTVASSLAILFTLSYEIIYLSNFSLSHIFIRLQLVICVIFLIDFSLRFTLSKNKGKFVLLNWLLLLVSVPLLNISEWLGIDLSSDNYVLYRLMPLIRGIYGLALVAYWISRSKITSLLVSYITTVVVFTYSASLLFYSLEFETNPELKNFGDAVWWAAMNLTTIGANIFAISPIGKVLTVILAALGMMMFPIFTAYIISRFENLSTPKTQKENQI